MVGKTTLIIFGILIIGFIAAGGVKLGSSAFSKIKLEATKIRESVAPRGEEKIG